MDENSSSASCSTELQTPSTHPQTRLSRATGQHGRTDAQQSQHAQTRLSRSRQVSTLQSAFNYFLTDFQTTHWSRMIFGSEKLSEKFD